MNHHCVANLEFKKDVNEATKENIRSIYGLGTRISMTSPGPQSIVIDRRRQ